MTLISLDWSQLVCGSVYVWRPFPSWSVRSVTVVRVHMGGHISFLDFKIESDLQCRFEFKILHWCNLFWLTSISHARWLFINSISFACLVLVDSLLNYSLDHSLCCLVTQIETDWRLGLYNSATNVLCLCRDELKLNFLRNLAPGK